MAERSPILSAKNDGRQIGYIEGNDVFDLLGRRRASSNGRTGNLYALDSGKIIGHVSLQGKFVGVSWIAAELFPIFDDDIHKEAVRREGYLHGSGVAGNINKPRDDEATDPVRGNGETPRRSSFERSKPTAELSSKSDGNTYQHIFRTAGLLNGPGVADESFERRDAAAAHAVRSIGETSSPPASEQSEPAAALHPKSWMAILTSKAVRKEGYLNGPGLVVAGEASVQPDAEEAHAASVGETPSSPPSEQDKPAAELSSKSDDYAHQKILRGEDALNGLSLALANENFGRRDVEVAYADHRIGGTPSSPPSGQNEPAAELSSKSDDQTHQEILRGDDPVDGPNLAVTDENIEPHAAEAAYADASIGEMPSLSPSQQGEAAASKSDDHTLQEILRGEDPLNGPNLAVTDEIIEPYAASAAYADASIDEMPSLPPSQQGEAAAELSSKSDDHTHQEIPRGEDVLDGLSLALADENFGRRGVEVAYEDNGIGEKPRSPPSGQDKPAAELSSESDDVEIAYADNGIGEMPSPLASEQDKPVPGLPSKSDDHTHQEILRGENVVNGLSLAATDEIIEPHTAKAAHADISIGEMPGRPPSQQDKPAAELSSESDDYTHQEILGGEDVRNRLSPALARENFGQRDVEIAYADPGNEMPSLSPPQQGEAVAELSSESDDHTLQEILRGEDVLDGLSLALADENFRRRDAEIAYADRRNEMPSLSPFQQDEVAAELSSKSDDHRYQEIRREEDILHGLSLALADENFGRRDVEVAYADRGIGEMPSPPPTEQDKPAAEPSSKSDVNKHQKTVRGENTLTGPSLAVRIILNVFFGTILGFIMLVLIIVIFQIDLTGVLL